MSDLIGSHQRTGPSRGGRLIVVSTPIGHLEDLSPRARKALVEADLIACEDTRRTGLLMAKLGTKRPLMSLHEHNERGRVTQILEALEEGATICLVSDAGTPLLSDPGFLVVRGAAEAGSRVETIPGPSAAMAALVVSALPPLPHTFLGFAPVKTGKRKKFYATWGTQDHTLILFESPHRIVKSLRDAHDVLGDRRAAVARELTKLHEEVLRGRLTELIATLEVRPRVKGEIVLVLAGESASAQE